MLGCFREGLGCWCSISLRGFGWVFLQFFGTIEGVFGCLWEHSSEIVGRFKRGNILVRCRIDI